MQTQTKPTLTERARPATVTGSPTYRATELGAVLARHYPEAAPHAVGRVVWLAQWCAKRAVAWELKRCNDTMSEAENEAGYGQLREWEAEINGHLAQLDMWRSPEPDFREGMRPHSAPAIIKLGGDARGPCAVFHVPGARGDGWGSGSSEYAIY